MSIELMTIAMFVVLIATIVTGLPLAYCLAGVATLFGLIDNLCFGIAESPADFNLATPGK